jgi:hypothetical protein
MEVTEFCCSQCGKHAPLYWFSEEGLGMIILCKECVEEQEEE